MGEVSTIGLDIAKNVFQVHGIVADVKPIDNVGAYWQKTQEVDVQMWRYEQGKFKTTDVQR